MIRVLIVEDEATAERDLRLALNAMSDDLHLVVAKSRTEALALIENDEWDLITCDLRIPRTTGSLDTSDVHGLAVHAAVEEYAAGTPMVIATGFATLENVSGPLADARVEFVYGNERIPLVQLTRKREPALQHEKLKGLIDDLRNLESILIEVPDGIIESDLDPMLVRAARRYAQWMKVASVRIVPFSGLSKAAVGRVELTDRNGALVWLFTKVMSRDDALKEYRRYAEHLPNRLQPSSFASSSHRFLYGLRKSAALFYTVAAPSQTLFQILGSDRARAAEIVVRLSKNLSPWAPVGRSSVAMTLSDLRSDRISDEAVLKRLRRDHVDGWPVISESTTLDVPWGSSHGDLHGANVLVDSFDNPVIIDFGDVGYGPTALDPVTLEFSVLFHPDSPAADSNWPSEEQAHDWLNLDRYLIGCPYPEFVRACRAWAGVLSEGQVVSALAYVHCLRQLKYPDVDAARALALAVGASKGLSSRQVP